jgi:hypothetical protein
MNFRKLLLTVLIAVSTFAAPTALMIAPAVLSGCRNIDPAGVYRGDKVLYNADKTIVDSYDILHAFVTFEFENREALKATPDVANAADQIRLNAQKWTDSAIALRDAYVASPTPENRSKLEDGVRVLRQAMTQAQNYMKKTKVK